MKFSIVIAALLMVVLAGTAQGEIYRYTDSKGTLHFVDDLSRVPKKYRNQLGKNRPIKDISVINDGRVSLPREADHPASRGPLYSGGDKVDIYVTSWCGYCKKMKRFLDEKGIPYTAHDIENDSDAERTYKQLGGDGVPLVRIGSHVVHGYNPDAVMSYLGR